MMAWVRLVLVVAVCLVIQVEPSKDVMHQLAVNFGKPLDICKQELSLQDSVIQEFFNFWKEGFEIKDRQTGCAIICIASKLDLLDADLEIHHGNTLGFAKKHGADEAMAKQLTDLIHACAQKFPPSNDPCQRALDIAMCFKIEIHKLDWAPNVELLIAEFLSES